MATCVSVTCPTARTLYYYNKSVNDLLMMTQTISLRFLMLCFFLLLCSACSTIKNMSLQEKVKPWEKDILAQKTMQIPSDAMFNFTDEHIFSSKEASTGGNSVGGGGCGCN